MATLSRPISSSCGASKMPYSRLIVISNPGSTNSGMIKRRISELRSACPEAEIILVSTSPQGRSADRRILSKHASKLGQGALICIAAGDGTINTVVEELMSDSSLSKSAKKTPILPLWCGNANDLACMLNGPKHRADLKRIIHEGRAVRMRPIECKMTDPGRESTTRYAASYASFGASAFVARVLAKFVRRNRLFYKIPGGRFMHELAIVSRSLMRAPTFAVREDDNKVRDIYERAFLKGSRFAKVGGIPQKLTNESFHVVTVSHKHFSAFMYRITEIIRKKRSRKFIKKQAKFMVLENAWAQFDGETVHIQPGTKVEVGLCKQPLYVLSLLLKDCC